MVVMDKAKVAKALGLDPKEIFYLSFNVKEIGSKSEVEAVYHGRRTVSMDTMRDALGDK